MVRDDALLGYILATSDRLLYAHMLPISQVFASIRQLYTQFDRAEPNISLTWTETDSGKRSEKVCGLEYAS